MRSKSSNNAINIITYIALVGVILGAAALFIVLSGFAGLKAFTLEFTSLIDPDFKVESTTGKSFILDKELQVKLQNLDGLAFYSKVIEERIMASSDGKQVMAFIKGVDQNFERVNPVDSIIEDGSWLVQDTPQIVTGYGIARNLSIGVLDYGKAISIYVPKPGKGQVTSKHQAFNTKSTINVGVFAVNEAIDNSYIFSSFKTAKDLLSYKDHQISSIEFRVNNAFSKDDFRAELESVFGKQFSIKDTSQLNEALHKMLNTENLIVYLIFTLILIIALFNIVGSIIMMLLDKQKNLSTLYNIGATISQIKQIFFYQGVLMTVIGGFIGLTIGYIIIQLQYSFSLIMLTPSLAYPVAITFQNFIVVFITITVLGVIASKIASNRITKDLIKIS